MPKLLLSAPLSCCLTLSSLSSLGRDLALSWTLGICFLSGEGEVCYCWPSLLGSSLGTACFCNVWRCAEVFSWDLCLCSNRSFLLSPGNSACALATLVLECYRICENLEESGLYFLAPDLSLKLEGMDLSELTLALWVD